ncbi:MAG: hypothetical protein HQL49_05320 [Gammaproteobacteria bacterium]|nr:hypothetical protein [Gammaproteobacteria bacterium]
MSLLKSGVTTLLLTLVVAFSTTLQAAEKLKPFILAYSSDVAVAAESEVVKDKLTAAGFTVVGSYVPYPEATILIVTSDALKKAAAASKMGGYGAVQRVALTIVAGKTQVSYTNPTYMAFAYRMQGDLADVTKTLASALGNEQAFGAKEGLTEAELRKYHYMFGMEYFDDYSEHRLGKFDSQAEAVETVAANLAKGVAGVTQVYRVDIPGKDETIFGVALKGSGQHKIMDDTFIMSEIDFQPLRSTAHLPVEILVSDGVAYGLFYRFRIAMNFPDLAMMGDNSFMNIMESPAAAKEAMQAVAKAK